MDPVSGALIAKALDALSMRQAFIAQNIANASTQNYRPSHVRFEDALAQAAGQDLDAIRSVEPTVHVQQDGSTRLDLQLAEASMTAMRYGALLELRSRQTALTRAAIGGGR